MSSIFRLLIVVAVLAFAASPALAQQIQGQVRLPGNTPAYNIAVECTGPGCVGYSYTDQNGKFRWNISATGNYTFTVKIPGYITESRSVTLIDAQASEYLTFQMRPDPSAGGAATSAAPAIDPKTPAPARKEYQAGLDEINKGKADKAVPHLEKAIELYKDFQEAYLLLGTAYMDQKQWDKAEAALRHVIEVNPKATAAYLALGDMYYQQKKYPEAEKELLTGLQMDDNSWQGHFTLAHVYVDTNGFDKAVPHIEKANKLRPDYADAHILAANIYIKTRNAEGALKEFEEYLRLAPKGKFAPQAQNAVTKLKEMLKK